jgi:hypothetical protein
LFEGKTKGKTLTEEVPKASLNSKKGDKTDLDEYIRSLYRRFLSLKNANGTVHLNERGKSGMAARSSRMTSTEDAEGPSFLHFSSLFPNPLAPLRTANL